MMQRMVLLVTLGLLFATSAVAADATLEGSADFESTHRGGATTKGKLFGLGKRIRTESEARGTSMTMIMDTEAQKMWMLVGPSCMEQSLAEGLLTERAALADIFASADYAEGLRAFAERRAPVFAE